MNQSKTIYLVRHGLSTHSTHGYGKKKLTAPMLQEGIPAILRLSTALKKLPDSANISSEIIRCRETAAIISQVTGKKFTFDKRLNEAYHETIGEIRQRVVSFLTDISHQPQTHVIICTHGVIIAAIKNLLVAEKFVTRQQYDYPQAGELVIVRGKNVETINFN